MLHHSAIFKPLKVMLNSRNKGTFIAKRKTLPSFQDSKVHGISGSFRFGVLGELLVTKVTEGCEDHGEFTGNYCPEV